MSQMTKDEFLKSGAKVVPIKDLVLNGLNVQANFN